MPRETATLRACRARVAELTRPDCPPDDTAFDLWKIARGAQDEEARAGAQACRRLAKALEHGKTSIAVRRSLAREIVKRTAAAEEWQRVAAAYMTIRKEG